MVTVVGVISIILLYLALPAILALGGLAGVSIFAFGGARRNALALLAAGVMCVITGAVYLYGVAGSHLALQDNAYLGNIYLGLLLMLLGASVALAGGLAGAGLNRWAAVALALLGVAGMVGVYGSVGLNQPAGGLYVAVYPVVALLVTLGVLLALRRADLAGAALGLGALGAALALAAYLLMGAVQGLLVGARQGAVSLAVYLQPGLDPALADKPPVLEGFGAAAALLLVVGVYLVARRRQGGAPAGAGQPAPASA